MATESGVTPNGKNAAKKSGKKLAGKSSIPTLEEENSFGEMASVPLEKKTIRKRQNYEKIDLITAVNEVKEKKISVSQAALKYGVPRRTIQDHVSGTVADFSKSGSKPSLTEEEELGLVDYVVYMSRKNLPLSRNDIRATIVQLIRRSGEDRIAKCLFNLEKGPSDNWFQGFEQRHPILKWVIPESLEKCTANQYSEYEVDNFYAIYENFLKNMGIQHKPANIFNVALENDIAPQSKAYGVKGETLYRAKNASLDCINVIMTVSADGAVLPSYLVYPQSLSAMPVREEMPQSWLYDTSTDGEMDQEMFKKWFNDLFLVNCPPARPVVLILDNNAFNISKEIINSAKENRVEIIGIPDYTSHMLQPLNTGIFESVKKKFNQMCGNAGIKSSRSCFMKPGFPQAWSNCIKQGATPSVIKQAFRKTGIYPFNPLEVDRSEGKADSTVAFGSVPEPAAVVTTTTSAAMDQMRRANMKLGPIVNEHSPCTTCGQYPHPVESVRRLPAELIPAFPVPSSAPRKTSTQVNQTYTSSDSGSEDDDSGTVEQQEKTLRLEAKCREMALLAAQAAVMQQQQLIRNSNKRSLEEDIDDGGLPEEKRITTFEHFEIGTAEVEVVDSDF